MSVAAEHELVERIWSRDPTVWTDSGEEKWLGWLDEPKRMQERVAELQEFAADARTRFDVFVLLGMGGSSLAPEVLKRTFGAKNLHVLDTTHPAMLRHAAAFLDLHKTMFVVSSKSGTTLETRSHFDYYWEQVGANGEQFVAVTDPGSELEQVAHERGMRVFSGEPTIGGRYSALSPFGLVPAALMGLDLEQVARERGMRVFSGEPTIGGRYSALSPFGLVPAALMGLDLERILDGAVRMADACRGEHSPGLELGLQLGDAWQAGRDKVCIAETDGRFGLWAEQLIAESTGKQGKGLVPAPGESPDGPDRQPGDVELREPGDIGAEFFRWEFAVAVAGSILQINPFDQPNVQAAKDKTKEVLASGEDPQLEEVGSLDELLAGAEPPNYVAIQAFIDPVREGELEPLISRARGTGCVVTHGLGPRYLHSTGQLHKGGPPTGLFVQVVDDTGDEIPIPGQEFGFGRLIRAQAEGDFRSLRDLGRKIVRVRI